MKKGKKAEKLLRIIQEALKNYPNTKIFSNYKIENTSGRKREVDVLLKTVINGFEIIIAIECKDYKTSVPAEKIEAFNSKCQRIKGISKKIFVATSGYQADAYNAAKYFDIELYNLNEINVESIIQWFQIRQLIGRYLLKLPHRIKIDAEEIDIEKVPTDKDLIIHFYEKRQPVTLNALLWSSVVYENQSKFKALLMLDFMKNECNLNYQTIIPYAMDFSGIYIKGENDKILNITRVESAIVAWLEEVPARILEARSYKKMDSETVANVVTIDAERNGSADIVFTKENDLKIFHTDEKGRIRQMQTLFEYDSKTGKLIKTRS